MKKILISCLLFPVLAMVSCSQDLLEIPQKGVVTIDDYYRPEDAEAAIAAVYSQGVRTIVSGSTNICATYIMLTNLPSDDMYAGGANRGDNDYLAEINEYRFTNQNVLITDLYRYMYEFIYSTNLFLTYYEYGMSNDIDRYVSEARIWRAWAHFFLATWWGNPPLVDKVLGATDKPTNTPHDEIMDWVIRELSDAAPRLPSRLSPNDQNGAVRLTKESAYAFLGKAQVFAGRYAEAATTLKTHVIDSGKFELVPGADMENLYHMAGDANTEKVFEFNVIDNPALAARNQRNVTHMWMHYNTWHWRTDHMNGVPPTRVRSNGWGGYNPSGVFARALIENDGINSHRRKAWFKTYDELLYELAYDHDDKVPTLADKQKDPERGVNHTGTGLFGHEGFFQWKNVPWKSDGIARLGGEIMDNNIVIMRYAEVLLLYAEACAQANTDLAGGLAALNLVQNRAGSAHVSTALTLDEVKREKRFECWMEGTRFPDLVRWGDAATALADNGKAIPTFKDLMGKEGYTIHTPFIDWEGSDYNKGSYGFKSGRNELLPFPWQEMLVNPNIVQNPGW